MTTVYRERHELLIAVLPTANEDNVWMATDGLRARQRRAVR
jgi:hypothetical protein